jgi:Domain of unknown function (DUF4917)
VSSQVSTPALPDGSLRRWADIEDEHPWQLLLLGNGLSINVWPAFGYSALFDYVRRGDLRDSDLALFEGSPNFERVLGDLGTAIRVAEVLHVDTAVFYERYYRVQQALGHAIRQVHLHRSACPDLALRTIREQMESYEWVFTTSYDLLVYWAMGYGEGYGKFKDHFRWGGRLEFDPTRAEVFQGDVPVYFLHGALHLMVGGTGVTWKLRRTASETVLDQFGQPVAGDPQARPLLVTEGSSREKLQAIEANDYLAHALSRLRELDLPVVVFGSSLSAEDSHLVDALNEHPRRPVAVSMYPKPRRELREEQGRIFGRLQTNHLLFFDSTTHPLGDSALRADELTGGRRNA